MKECLVSFDNSLSDAEMEQMFEVFRRFKGVTQVRLADGQKPHAEEKPKVQINTGNLEDIALQQAEKQSLERDRRKFIDEQGREEERQVKSSAKSGIATESQNNDAVPPRHAINFALKWAIGNRKIGLKDLERLKPEDVVKLAMGIISELPELEKKKLGRELSEMGMKE